MKCRPKCKAYCFEDRGIHGCIPRAQDAVSSEKQYALHLGRSYKNAHVTTFMQHKVNT